MWKITIIVAAILSLSLVPIDASAKGKPAHTGKGAHDADDRGHHKSKQHRKGYHKKAHYKKKHREHTTHHHVVHEVVYQRGGPPPWAPAHGYRHQRKHRRAEVHYAVPFGIAVGTCHRDALGAAIGAAGGGLLAAELSDGDSRAIFGGILGGALLGGALGDAVSGADRDCFGQALEHAPSSETVTWRNPDEDTTYQFTPTRTYASEGDGYCREYTTLVSIGGREESAYGTACRQADGSWEPL
jgi:surface antigen